MLTCGDPATQRALMVYWQQGGEHPIATMGEDDIHALDRDIAQAVVLAATCDPAAQVRQKPADGASRP